VKQNISLKTATDNARIRRPHLDLHVSYEVYSHNRGEKNKQKIQALNHQGIPRKQKPAQ